MPARKQGVPERKACCGKTKRVADDARGRTMMTQSMQREKEKRQNLCDAVKSLPNLSGILIQAINACKSAKGLSFTELKEVLTAKGYNLSRYCPSIKRQLKLLASQGALVRMTHKAGSTFFVIKKQQEKEASSTQAAVGPEKLVRTQKMGAERTNCQRVSEKLKGGAAQAKSSGLKVSEARGEAQVWPKRKWKLGEKQPRPTPGQSSPAKTPQRPIKNTVSTIKRLNNSTTNTVPATKMSYHSWGKAASSKKSLRSLRRTTTNAAQKPGRPISQAGSKRSRRSKKGLRGPHHHTTPSVKASKYSRSKTPFTGKKGRRSRGKALMPPPRSNSGRTHNTESPRRI